MEITISALIGLLIFMVLGGLASALILMPDDHFNVAKWRRYAAALCLGLCFIFSVFAAHYVYHGNEQAKVKREMQEAKTVAVITCLEKRYHIKHLVFGIFEYEKTGERFRLSDNTWETCKDAN